MLGRIYDAVDSRLKVKEVWRDVADHRVPDHANPRRRLSAFVYCFGGITAAIVLTMFLTGLFLVVYYVPSPDHAYDSVQFIRNDVTLGWLVQGIHHWGASAAVVMVVLHFLRVYVHGAYKNPRELNWVVGVLLMGIIIGFGFTGYLLPWHQRAYWATSVGTNMAGLVPLVGDFILKALRGGADVGAVTLVRFYAIHIGFLPALGALLLGLHVIMIRRQGIAGPL